MDLINRTILIGALLLFLGLVAGALSRRLGMPLLLAFLGVGMLAGEDGPGGIVFNDIHAAYLIGSVALAIILFDGGMNTRVATFRFSIRPAFTLATLGVIITSTLTGAFAAWIFDLPWLYGLLIGATVGSTDAAAVFALLRAHGVALEQRVAATLEIESASNDPMAIFLTLALVQMLAQGGEASVTQALLLFLIQMGIGAGAGLIGGKLLVWLIERAQLEPGLYPLLALAGGACLFAATAVAGGSGFLAIYLAGVVLGNSPVREVQGILNFHSGIAWLAQSIMFLMLGLLATPRNLLPYAFYSLAIAAVLMLAARPIAVSLCLAPFHFSWREHIFIGWVGLRGAVPIILALFPAFYQLPNSILFLDVAFFLVIVSLVAQGWTIAPLARRLRLEVPPTPEPDQIIALGSPPDEQFALFGYRLRADSGAVDYRPAELGLPAEVHFAGLIRDDRWVDADQVKVLLPRDFICLLGDRTALESINELFAVAVTPKRLEKRVFFGNFVLDGVAPVAQLAAFYGISFPDARPGQTLGDYLANRFHNQPVVGDTIDLGPVELVVREIKDGRIARVGLKLPISTSESMD